MPSCETLPGATEGKVAAAGSQGCQTQIWEGRKEAKHPGPSLRQAGISCRGERGEFGTHPEHRQQGLSTLGETRA